MMYAVDAIYFAVRIFNRIRMKAGKEQITNGTAFRQWSSNYRFNGISG